MKYFLTYFLLTLVTLVLSKNRNTYEGWKLYRFWPPNEYLLRAFSALHENENFDVWTTIREENEPVDIAVAEVAHPSFENLLYKLNVTNEVQIESIEKALNREMKEMNEAANPEKGNINFAKYHRYSVIMDYLNSLEKKYEDIVTVRTIGVSVEGRDIKVVKIGVKEDRTKPAVLIDAALSPREWIGPAQALYIIRELVENANNKEIIENVDWYIIPIANPDGYEYTHSTERLWKKNRSQNKNHYGVYLNRNFDIDFGLKHTSSIEYAWNYNGINAFSEPETLTLKRFIEDNSAQIKLYLSFHSFGPMILYPYGFTNNPPKTIEKVQSLAEKVAEELGKKTKIPYEAKRASTEEYTFSGNSIDWAVAKAGIPYAYTINLPSPGYLGFDFPVHRLEETVKNFIIGIEVFYEVVKDYNYVKFEEKDEL